MDEDLEGASVVAIDDPLVPRKWNEVWIVVEEARDGEEGVDEVDDILTNVLSAAVDKERGLS